MIPVIGYKNCFVGVLGLGKTGLATASALKLGGAYPLCWDDDLSVRKAAQHSGIEIENLNSDKILEKVVALIISPGIPHLYPAPHPIVQKALSKGIIIDNDISLFFRSFASEGWNEFDVTPKVICVTGSNGKSTTTALLEHILFESGMSVETGGNIGRAVLTMTPAIDGDIKVLEVSSYQVELARTLQPDLAVFLNFSPDHADRHSGHGGYFAAKSRLFSMGGPEKCIIGIDENEGLFLSNVMREELLNTDPVIVFSVNSKLTGSRWAVFVHKGFLVEWRNGKQVGSIDLREKLNLVGKHNHQNICAAYASCRALGLAPRRIQEALDSFRGLKHRAQIIGKKNGVTFVNDSKATNSTSTAKALAAFKNIRWIVGGKEKQNGLTDLIPVNANVKEIYLIGSSQESFSRQLTGISHIKCDNLDTAFKVAFEDSVVGDTILLAPACASFDQFRSFEDRGNRFIELFDKI